MSEQQKRLSGTQNINQTNYINLVELMYRLLENWVLVLSLALVFGIATGAYTHFFITPLYRAKSTIYVLSRHDSAINMSDLQIGSALTSDYIKVFEMWEVHEEVISNLNLPYDYIELEKMVSVNNSTNTRMLDISVTNHDPQEAADIANEYAKVVSLYIADTMSTDKPNIMSVARVPVNPISPSLTKNIAVGFLLGVLLAGAIVFYQMINDDKYKTAEDIRKYTGLVTFALIPLEDEFAHHPHNKRKK